jgi:hypothetical protein
MIQVALGLADGEEAEAAAKSVDAIRLSLRQSRFVTGLSRVGSSMRVQSSAIASFLE